MVGGDHRAGSGVLIYMQRDAHALSVLDHLRKPGSQKTPMGLVVCGSAWNRGATRSPVSTICLEGWA